MKKLILIFILVSSYGYSQTAPTSGAYETDQSDYFVAGNRVNESLERVNLLLCYLENTKPVDFLNKGTYVATIFEDDCNFGKAKAGDKDKANKSSGGSTGNKNNKKTGGKKTGKAGNTVFLNVTQSNDASAMEGKVWIQLKAAPINTTATDGGTATPGGQGGPGGGGGLPFDATVYLKHSQTSNPSAASKLGDFTMNYSMYVDATKVAQQFAPAAVNSLAAAGVQELDQASSTQKQKIEQQNFSLGNGYINSSGQTIKFKEAIMGGTDISITYTASGASGVYTTDTWDNTYASNGGNGSLLVYYAFIIDDTNKWLCEKIIGATTLPDYNALFSFNDTSALGIGEGIEATGINVDLSNTGLSTNEICYSTAREDAYVNVHQYGIYDSNGDQAGLAGGSFPIRANNSAGDDYYGWADYWGVWVDTYGRNAFDPTASGLAWKRDDGLTSGPCTSEAGCTLTKKYTEITKFATSYRNLNSINKIKLSIYVADSYWAAEWGHADILNTTARNGGNACSWSHFDDVNNAVCYSEYEGYWDSTSSSLILTHGMKWSRSWADPNNPQDPKVQLSSNITIPAAEFVDHMKKTYGSDNYVIDLWTWSPDTFESFMIPGAAFSAPASTAAGVGLKNETIDRISVAQLQSDLTASSATGLTCINNCVDPKLLNDRYTTAAAALSDNDTANDNVAAIPVASIFDANAATWHDPNTGVDGDKYYIDGITASYAKDYIINNGKLWYENANSADNEMTIFSATETAFASATTKQEQPVGWSLGSLQAQRPGYDSQNTWETEYIGWSARTGFLVKNDDTTLASLKCRTRANGTDYVEFDSDHPRYVGNATLMNATRYCYDKINQGAISTYYEIGILMEGSYELSEGGTKIVFEQPKNLKLDPSNWTASQKTAGGMSAAEAEKTYSLWFEGFGKLFNIPGGVFNTCTGEDMGEYFYGNWDEQCHRWASKFTLPKGTYLTDEKGTPADTSDDVIYWVKPLLGDEFLKVLTGGAIPSQTRDYSGLSASILGEATNLLDMGPNGSSSNYIGTIPTSVLNDGDPSVIHGKVTVQPPSN